MVLHFFLEFVMIVSSPFFELAPKWRRGSIGGPTFVKSILVGSSFLPYFSHLGQLAQTHLSQLDPRPPPPTTCIQHTPTHTHTHLVSFKMILSKCSNKQFKFIFNKLYNFQQNTVILLLLLFFEKQIIMNIIKMLVNQQQHYLGLEEQTPSQLKEEKKAQLYFC